MRTAESEILVAVSRAIDICRDIYISMTKQESHTLSPNDRFQSLIQLQSSKNLINFKKL